MKHRYSETGCYWLQVAPYVGAWIETLCGRHPRDEERTSHPTWVRGLKLIKNAKHIKPGASHPTWVRGLKPENWKKEAIEAGSHPTWVRGLKLLSHFAKMSSPESHPTWVRGLKPELMCNSSAVLPSHPTWVRGLKHFVDVIYRRWCSRTLRGCVD